MEIVVAVQSEHARPRLASEGQGEPLVDPESDLTKLGESQHGCYDGDYADQHQVDAVRLLLRAGSGSVHLDRRFAS